MGRLSELKHRREELLEIAARHHASSLAVFGSVARDEDTAISDIDFLVVGAERMSLFDLGGLYEDLRESLGCPIDIVTLNALKGSQREQILKEAIVL
jgi:uncharacterized protein